MRLVIKERAHIIHFPPKYWPIFGFIDDTFVRTSRPGLDPVGLEVGHGRPTRQDADWIQHAFYRGRYFLLCCFYDATYSVTFS